jgi:hypothetical protein
VGDVVGRDCLALAIFRPYQQLSSQRLPFTN